VATDSLFKTLVVDDATIADTSRQVGPLATGKQYFWRVSATTGGVTSKWSAVWDFRTTGLGPVLANIPDQTILLGGRFQPIRVDPYVSDPDNSDTELTWSVSGATNLTFIWDSLRRRYRIRSPRNWTGSETVTFTVTDPDQNSDSDQATFTVSPGAFSPGEHASLEFDVPDDFELGQNYPNPFNPTTTIRYGVPVRSAVRMEVYSVLGERVAILVDSEQEAGYYSLNFGGVGSGVYYYVVTAKSTEDPSRIFRETRKMILMK
jgi:hypothetical protein